MGFYNTISTQEIASSHRLRYLTWIVPDLLLKIRALENPWVNPSEVLQFDTQRVKVTWKTWVNDYVPWNPKTHEK